MKSITCRCDRKYKEDTEQGICISLHGACIVCLKDVLTQDQLDGIRAWKNNKVCF